MNLRWRVCKQVTQQTTIKRTIKQSNSKKQLVKISDNSNVLPQKELTESTANLTNLKEIGSSLLVPNGCSEESNSPEVFKSSAIQEDFLLDDTTNLTLYTTACEDLISKNSTSANALFSDRTLDDSYSCSSCDVTLIENTDLQRDFKSRSVSEGELSNSAVAIQPLDQFEDCLFAFERLSLKSPYKPMMQNPHSNSLEQLEVNESISMSNQLWIGDAALCGTKLHKQCADVTSNNNAIDGAQKESKHSIYQSNTEFPEKFCDEELKNQNKTMIAFNGSGDSASHFQPSVQENLKATDGDSFCAKDVTTEDSLQNLQNNCEDGVESALSMFSKLSLHSNDHDSHLQEKYKGATDQEEKTLSCANYDHLNSRSVDNCSPSLTNADIATSNIVSSPDVDMYCNTKTAICSESTLPFANKHCCSSVNYHQSPVLKLEENSLPCTSSEELPSNPENSAKFLSSDRISVTSIANNKDHIDCSVDILATGSSSAKNDKGDDLSSPAVASSSLLGNVNDTTTVLNEEPLATPQPGAYTIDFSKFDDPNFDPFKSGKAISNSPDKEFVGFSKSFSSTRIQTPDVDITDNINKPSLEMPLSDSGKHFHQTIETVPNKSVNDKLPTQQNEQNHLLELSGETAQKEKLVEKPSAKTALECTENVKAKDIPSVVELSSDILELKKCMDAHDEKPECKTVVDVDVNGSAKLPAAENKDSITDCEIHSFTNNSDDVSTTIETKDQPFIKGSYSFDISKFDDPNFDPFKSNKSLVNDVLEEDSPKPIAIANLNDSDNSVFDPLKAKATLENSEVNLLPLDKSCDQEVLQVTTSNDTEKTPAEKSNGDQLFLGHKNASIAITEEVSERAIEVDCEDTRKANAASTETGNAIEDVETETSIPAKGAYTMDFSNFDDPNFDPFKSNKSLSNEDQGKEEVGEFPAKANSNTTSFNPELNKTKEVKEEIESINIKAVADSCNESEMAVLSEKQINSQEQINSKAFSKKTKVAKSKVKKKMNKSTEVPSSEEPTDIVPKGSYSIDFSKFDDPNFDPFKTNKSLVNDGEGAETGDMKGAYTLHFDDPNADPFQSKRAIANSPTKLKENIQILQSEENLAFNESEAIVHPSLPKVDKEDIYSKEDANNCIEFEDPNFDSLNTKKTLVNDEEQSLVRPDSGTDFLKFDESKEFSAPIDDLIGNSSTAQSFNAIDKELLLKEEADLEKNVMKEADIASKKDELLVSHLEELEIQNYKVEMEEEPTVAEEASDLPPKGSYTIDFSKFDDPNFDPFKTNKALSNEDTKVTNQEAFLEKTNETPTATKVKRETPEKPKTKATKSKRKLKVKKSPKIDPPVSEDPDPDLPPKGSYSIDFSKFDDPNFNPFESKETLSNGSGAKTGETTQPFDDSGVDPFKSNKSILNSPTIDIATHELRSEKDAKLLDTGTENFMEKSSTQDTTALKLSKESEAGKDGDNLKSKSKVNKVKVKKISEPSELESKAEEVESDLPPKGSYTMDFSKFDDPNFNPFESKETLSNGSGAKTGETTKPFDDSGVDPFKSNKSILNFPTTDVAAHELKSEGDAKLLDTEKSLEKSCTQDTTAVELGKGGNSEKDGDNLKSKSKVNKVKVKKICEPSELESKAEEVESDLPPKGSYSMDFSKFDDPNFDPFKSSKSLLNDGEDVETRPAPGSYTVDFNDPNLDPFKSNKTVVSSPTRSIPGNANVLDREVLEMEAVSKKSNAFEAGDAGVEDQKESTSEKKVLKTKPKLSSSKVKKKAKKPPQKDSTAVPEEDSDLPPKGAYSFDFSKFDDPSYDPFKSNKSLKNDDDKTGIKPGMPVSEQDNCGDPDSNLSKSTESTTPLKAVDHHVGDGDSASAKLQEIPQKASDSVPDDRSQTVPDETGPPKAKPKLVKKKLKKKRLPVKRSEGNAAVDDPVPKASYAIDFDKFDDPNFNPFQSGKSLSNEPVDELPKPGAYTVDFDKFDDPNFDPFKSKKTLSNVQEDSQKSVTPVNFNDQSQNAMPSQEKTAGDLKISDEILGVEDVSPLESDVALNETFSCGTATALDLEKLDDPDFDPFKSSKTLLNSPLKEKFESGSNDAEDPNKTFVIEAADITDNQLPTLPHEEEPASEGTGEDQFQPAEQVFGDSNSNNTWDEFCNKQNKNLVLTESELRKQSLYVQFDPLVEPTAAIDAALLKNTFNRTGEPDSIEANASFHENSTEVNSNRPIRGSDMNFDQSRHHPAANQLALNMSREKWNESQDTTGSHTLISFSPSLGQHESPRSDDVLSREDGRRDEDTDAIRHQMMRLLQKKEDLLKRIARLNQDVAVEQMELEVSRATAAELEKTVSNERNLLNGAISEYDRVFEDIISAKRVYQEYHTKASDLLPVLQGHKQTHDELRVKTMIKYEELKKETMINKDLKKKAKMLKMKLDNEVSMARSSVEREMNALQAKLKKEQMTVASLSASLQDKSRENEELTTICDELIAGAERKS